MLDAGYMQAVTHSKLWMHPLLPRAVAQERERIVMKTSSAPIRLATHRALLIVSIFSQNSEPSGHARQAAHSK